jgi:uncharacterized membrane protein
LSHDLLPRPAGAPRGSCFALTRGIARPALTSRATVLLTIEGNHVRLPNPIETRRRAASLGGLDALALAKAIRRAVGEDEMRCKSSLVLMCLTPAIPAAAAVEDTTSVPLACRGNEPFWQLRIDRAAATYQRLGEAATELAGSAVPLDHLPRPELVWRGGAVSLGGDLVAWITTESCLDTMSDREGTSAFSHRIRISLPAGEVLTGCCQTSVRAAAGGAIDHGDLPVADLSAKPAADWTRLLLDLVPAIEACLAASPGPAPHVTKAWPMNRGMVGVRTRNGAGGWFACIAPAPGGAVDRFEPVPPGTSLLPGEGAAVFSPAAQAPPAGVCYRHERVLRADGALLGLLSYDIC